MKIKVGLAESNPLFRKVFLQLIRSHEDFDFIFGVENGANLLLKLESSTTDVILFDIWLPGENGFETAKIIRRKYPAIKIIALTQFDLEQNIIEMTKIGIKSFIEKNQVKELPRILRIVNHGGVYFPDTIAEILRAYLNRVSSIDEKCPFPLSDLERVMLQSILKGKSASQIGELIHKSPRTVEKYRNELYRKFNVPNHQQLIVEATRLSLT